MSYENRFVPKPHAEDHWVEGLSKQSCFSSPSSHGPWIPSLSQVKKPHWGVSLAAQWWRVRLPMQETWVQPLLWEDPTGRGATKPVSHSYWACALEPTNRNPEPTYPNYESLCTLKVCAQHEKPLQWETHTPQPRVAPTRHNQDPKKERKKKTPLGTSLVIQRLGLCTLTTGSLRFHPW